MAFARADPGPLWRRRLEAGAKEARAQEAQPEEPGETGAPPGLVRAGRFQELSGSGSIPGCTREQPRHAWQLSCGLDSCSPDTTRLGACCLSTNGVDSAEVLF